MLLDSGRIAKGQRQSVMGEYYHQTSLSFILLLLYMTQVSAHFRLDWGALNRGTDCVGYCYQFGCFSTTALTDLYMLIPIMISSICLPVERPCEIMDCEIAGIVDDQLSWQKAGHVLQSQM